MRVFLGGSKNYVKYVLRMYIFYESACIIDYCTCWIVGEWFVCIAISQVCVEFGEVVSSVHYADGSTFITWFHDDGLVILEVAQC